MRLADLMPADYNPRTITKAARRGLKASLQRYGLASSLTWNRRTGRIVGGHQRAAVLREDLGIEEAAVTVVDLDETDEAALNVALNSPEIAGDFDRAKLAALLDGIQAAAADTYKALRLGTIDPTLDRIRHEQIVAGIATTLATEAEHAEAAGIATEVADAIRGHLERAAARDPKAINAAFAIVVPLRRGRDLLVFGDPDLADAVEEIRQGGIDRLMTAVTIGRDGTKGEKEP
jgi:ParB-like chromosome segregation protein Spo0J